MNAFSWTLISIATWRAVVLSEPVPPPGWSCLSSTTPAAKRDATAMARQSLSRKSQGR